MTTSLTDILTAAKNLVVAVNGLTQAYTNVEGAQNAPNITTTTLVAMQAGRLCTVSVIAGGSATGSIYDSNSVGGTTRPLYVIPTTVGVYRVNLPTTYGILVAPGTGQTVTISFS